MQTRLQLLHTWTDQLHALLPELRLTRVRVLALLSLGLLWAGCVSLPRVAAAIPQTVQDLSTERRLRRWLGNRAVRVVPTWQPLARAFLARLGRREVVLVFDPTPYTERATLLILGLVVGDRVLPLAWHIVPGTTRWRHGMWAYLEHLWQRVAAILPPEITVTLIMDRGLTSATVLEQCAKRHWHVVLRLSADAQQGVAVRLADGTVCPVWDLVTGPGQRWDGQVATFQQAGWRTVHLTIYWECGYDEPWLLISDRPAGAERVAEYRQRVRVEASYQDWKSRGWNLEASRIVDLNKLNRLLLALVIATWWAYLLGRDSIAQGQQRQLDRTDRRDLSVMRLGRRWMHWLLDRDRLPPLPFHFDVNRWICRWQL